MAKKKKKKSKDALMLPKRIAGVKVPKPLRRQSKHLAELARHPLVADIVAAGILAIAAGVRDKSRTPAPASDDEPPAPDAAPADTSPAKPSPRRRPVAATAGTDTAKPAPKPRARRKPSPPKTTH